MASSRRTPDPLRIASAKISGIVERCVIARQLTEDEALVEIGASLAALPDVRWPDALAVAAARHVDGATVAHEGVLALLVRAGADLDSARAVRASRGGSFLIR